jgi:hypothetical protein
MSENRPSLPGFKHNEPGVCLPKGAGGIMNAHGVTFALPDRYPIGPAQPASLHGTPRALPPSLSCLWEVRGGLRPGQSVRKGCPQRGARNGRGHGPACGRRSPAAELFRNFFSVTFTTCPPCCATLTQATSNIGRPTRTGSLPRSTARRTRRSASLPHLSRLTSDLLFFFLSFGQPRGNVQRRTSNAERSTTERPEGRTTNAYLRPLLSFGLSDAAQRVPTAPLTSHF